MSYLIEGIEYAVLVGLAACALGIFIISLFDRIDFHYSKKRKEISNWLLIKFRVLYIYKR